MKSVVLLLTLSPDRSTAVRWARELEKNGFACHTAYEIKKAFQVNQHAHGWRSQILSGFRRSTKVQDCFSTMIHLELQGVMVFNELPAASRHLHTTAPHATIGKVGVFHAESTVRLIEC